MLIFDVLKPHFKSLNNTKLTSLAKAEAITCVAYGLRASHLIDIAYIDQDKANQLLRALRKLPECRSLVLLQFKDRFTFICHSERLSQHIKTTLKQPDQFTFVAVEGKEPRPIEFPNGLVAWIKKLQLSKHTYYSPIVPTCMVALTGWLLDYPVIYTTHLDTDSSEDELDEWETRTNCLGGQTLNLVQVFLTSQDDSHMLLSFSYTPGVQPLIEPFKLKMEQRLVDAQARSDWLIHYHINMTLGHMKLDRFAL
ncbi:uncharacterized protein B0P05DRAFT_583611 [Gilbertella persicaria]|uniref:uncharacterized protein n=1 Tax=Gilbertella persicaria TaxID=101096 RepID=UPI00221ECA93|nr:uncharacterized protein B0P05DRAFT_583611 [Gilbertella persicaria]KAI8092356.1 hypothetical protein B0P05DRAFT_583611 [Gilbertella persicaria]